MRESHHSINNDANVTYLDQIMVVYSNVRTIAKNVSEIGTPNKITGMINDTNVKFLNLVAPVPNHKA